MRTPNLLCAAAALLLPVPSAAAAPHNYVVVIDKMKFGSVPAQLHPGDTILWVNRDFLRHSATAANHSQAEDQVRCRHATFRIRKNGARWQRGITVHRQGCASLSRLAEESAERLIAAEWGKAELSKGGGYEVDIEIEAADRQGLLHDISTILLREKINVTATRTHSHHHAAIMRFTLLITSVAQLNRLLGLMGLLEAPPEGDFIKWPKENDE